MFLATRNTYINKSSTMISRKDNLLIRPYQQKKFENHLRKIKSATPAIDNKSPIERFHVQLKLKKKQKEKERCHTIENDNFCLFKKLDKIMKTSRIDNWLVPRPNLLEKVALYNVVITKIDNIHEDTIKQEIINNNNQSKRKSRCLACSPQIQPQTNIPEERIPWLPVKKERSKSVPIEKLSNNKKYKKVVRPSTTSEKKIPKEKFTSVDQTIILRKGSLSVSVNFPPDTEIELLDGKKKKKIKSALCYCRNIKKVH